MSTTENDTTAPAIITRREHMERSGAAFRENGDSWAEHELYHAQFVTDETLRQVTSCFGIDLLVAELPKDRALNTIPLERWDRLCWISSDPSNTSTWRNPTGSFRSLLAFDRDAAEAAGESITRATLVCIAKTAARIAVERKLAEAAA